MRTRSCCYPTSSQQFAAPLGEAAGACSGGPGAAWRHMPEARPGRASLFAQLAPGWLCVMTRPWGHRLQWSTPLALPYTCAQTEGLASFQSGVCPSSLPVVWLTAGGEWREPVRIQIHSLAGLARQGAGVRALVTPSPRASLEKVWTRPTRPRAAAGLVWPSALPRTGKWEVANVGLAPRCSSPLSRTLL